jgi:hypothetical protein
MHRIPFVPAVYVRPVFRACMKPETNKLSWRCYAKLTAQGAP